jgi:hypothetical protein
MAAHSGTSPVIAAVQADQPVGGWPAWLREIAAAVNVLGQWANRPVLPGVTFGALPVPPQPGSLAFVTDSTVAAWGAVVAGGGANKVLAWHNGTSWKVIGI